MFSPTLSYQSCGMLFKIKYYFFVWTIDHLEIKKVFKICLN